MPNYRHCPLPKKLLALFLLCFQVGLVHAVPSPPAELLTYKELLELYERESPSAHLQLKLKTLLTTPFVNNDATANGTRPLKPRVAGRGRQLRVAQWNIERGVEYEAVESVFTDPAKFVSLLDQSKYPEGSAARALVLEQAVALKDADIIVLNEVDWGMKRTGYRNVIADLASALKMNYAFGTEFIEIDPINLGTEEFEGMEEADRTALADQIVIDSERYRGLHGTAILSRFPLHNVRLIPYQTQGHDWYAKEKNGISKIEKGKRKVGEIAFQEKVEREVRRGGRMMLLADIEDPEIPKGRLTIVATHLESKTKPKSRVKQLEEVLATIKGMEHPVILAGDMNTSTRDSTPSSFKREIKKRFGSRKFWVKQSIKFLTGFSWPNSLLLGGLNEYRKQADPTVRSIHFVASNPEAKFFETLKKFRFNDGGAFDFRGERERSVGSGNSPLANSNQRGSKGFITTFEVERTIGFIGKFKLDWIFVKPPTLKSPYGLGQPYLFAPHFGRTLKELNHSIEDRISDHDPLIVDLPFGETGNTAQFGRTPLKGL